MYYGLGIVIEHDTKRRRTNSLKDRTPGQSGTSKGKNNVLHILYTYQFIPLTLQVSSEPQISRNPALQHTLIAAPAKYGIGLGYEGPGQHQPSPPGSNNRSACQHPFIPQTSRVSCEPQISRTPALQHTRFAARANACLAPGHEGPGQLQHVPQSRDNGLPQRSFVSVGRERGSCQRTKWLWLLLASIKYIFPKSRDQ